MTIAISKLQPASVQADSGVKVGVNEGVGVKVGMGVEVGVTVDVGVRVEVGVDVNVGPNNCPGPQAETMKLTNKQVTMVWKCFFMETSSQGLKQKDADAILKSTTEVGELGIGG